MPLTLSELFHQQSQKLSSEQKKEQDQLEEDVNNEGGKSCTKRNRNEFNGDIGSQSTIQNKRLKTESTYKIKHEGESSEEEVEMDEDDEDDEDSHVDMTDDQFYVNYSETAQAFYFSSKEEDNLRRQNHPEDFEAIHSALFPSKKRGALTLSNERRLAGDDADGFTSKSLTGRYRPRKKKVTTKSMSGKKETTYRLETHEEVQDRVQRIEGYAERSILRNRWKNRTVNFQDEKDVGDAFLSRAEQYLGSKLRLEKKQRRIEDNKERKKRRRERKRKEREKAKEQEITDDLEEDDELKEQIQLLALLSQNNNTVPKKDDEDSIHHNGSSSTMPPQALNYWDLGYSMPRKGDISYNFNPSVENMVQNSSMVRNDFKEDDCMDRSETKASFRALMTQQFGQRSSRFFFALNRTIITNANNTFRPGYRSGHVQHFLTMAAKHLCSSGWDGNEFVNGIALEDRYLRLLCVRSVAKSDTDVTVCANFRMSGYLTRISDEQGQNMLLFLQNTWNNPTEVLKKLGILNSYQDSPINGNMLTKITTHCHNNRSKIKRLHKICSIKKMYNITNNDIDIEQGVTEEESAIVTNDKIVPDATTSGGIADVMTMKSGSTICNKTTPTISQNFRDALIAPTSLYSHIAGTSPPIPQCPLDPTSFLFGPVDRHSKFYHVSVKMDSSIYKLMLSTLMARIGKIRTSNKNHILSKTQKQILELIEEFTDINENKLYLRYTNYIQDLSDMDIPLVEFNRGITGYCNFVANGCHEMCHEYISPCNDESNKTCAEDDELLEVSGMNQVAEKIWELCRTKIRRNGLIGFPKLRVIFGVALICRSLPSSAAEILSRPIDNFDFCTPLDLFKYTLEDLETKKYITGIQNHEDNCTLAVELEFIFHDASECFQEAVKIDPINVDFQLWHIGCLASCLLISSGNKISAGVHAYPSQKKSVYMSCEGPAHELRQCMKKYDDVRLELSVAVNALFTLAKYQDSAKAHFAVFTLIEWGQAIGLLVGGPLQDFVDDIKRLHDYHFEVWAHKEPASFLRKFSNKEKHSFDISFYAKILENDPGKIENWRNFVLCLGPISKTKEGNCWGQDRRWWGDNLLHILPLTTVSNEKNGKYDSLTIEIMLARLNKVSISIVDSPVTDNTGSNGDNNGNSARQSIDWLPTRDDIMAQSKIQFDVSKNLRSKCYANDLPRTNHKVFDSEMDVPPILSSDNMSLPKLSSLSQEAQAYKLYIFCHLFEQNHSLVQEHIYYNLFSNIYSNIGAKTVNDDCDEFRILVWFVSMGIDMERIFSRREKTVTSETLRSSS